MGAEDVTLEEIRETIRLDEFLVDLGLDTVRPTTSGWQNTPCQLPTHLGRDLSPSFGVNEEWLTFNCFTCDEKGSIIKLASLLKDISYEEALEYVLSFTDIDLNAWDDDGVKFIERIREILEKAAERQARPRVVELPYFSRDALRDYPACPLELLQKWQIEKSYTAQVFELRYSEQHQRRDYVGPAILIPHVIRGDMVGWQERWLQEDRPDNLPKYTNTSDFPRRTTLFNQDRALNLGDPVIVVESVMTVIRLFELGYTAVATFGGSINDEQKRILQRFSTVVLAYDNDVTGRKADRTLGEYLSDYTDVYKVPFPPESKADLADLPESDVHRLIDSAKNYMEAIWELT